MADSGRGERDGSEGLRLDLQSGLSSHASLSPLGGHMRVRLPPPRTTRDLFFRRLAIANLGFAVLMLPLFWWRNLAAGIYTGAVFLWATAVIAWALIDYYGVLNPKDRDREL
jgi:hypothetical protein